MADAPPRFGPAFLAKARGRANRLMRTARLHTSIRRIHGPARFPPGDAPIAVCLIRNGAYYLDPFFAHHRALGVSQFVFVDNGSDDGTADRIAAEPGTAILRSTLPAGRFENALREYAARRYCTGRWCLFVDSDELFDFPASERTGISGLVRYLAAGGYTGLVAQMLDMFPTGPLRDQAHLSYAEAIAAFDQFDISCVRKLPYHSCEADIWPLLRTNTISSEAVQVYYGGVREKFFFECCCLTKHPLVHVSGAVVPGRQPHCSTHLRIADVTGLIRHYKFANDPVTRDAESVRGNFWTHGEDARRLDRFRRAPDLSLYTDAAQPFRGIGPLVDQGFLLTSMAYTEWVELRPSARGERSTST